MSMPLQYVVYVPSARRVRAAFREKRDAYIYARVQAAKRNLPHGIIPTAGATSIDGFGSLSYWTCLPRGDCVAGFVDEADARVFASATSTLYADTRTVWHHTETQKPFMTAAFRGGKVTA